MSQTKKGKRLYFGMKAIISVDVDDDLIPTVEWNTANDADNVMLIDFCTAKSKCSSLIAAIIKKIGHWNLYKQKMLYLNRRQPRNPRGGELTEQQKKFNRGFSAIRTIVEQPFRIIKRQFGYVKVRFCGLKNTGQIMTLFALSSLWIARYYLMPTVGEERL